MSYEVTGKLIEKYDTQRVSDRFQKREFVIEFTEMINGQPSQYPNFIKLTLVQQKVDIVDRFEIGNNIKVSFNLRGSRYEKDGKVSYFTNLDAWRIEQVQEGSSNDGGYNNAGNNYQQQPQQQQAGSNSGGNWSSGNGNNGNNGGNWSNNSSAPAQGNNASFSQAATENTDDLPF